MVLEHVSRVSGLWFPVFTISKSDDVSGEEIPEQSPEQHTRNLFLTEGQPPAGEIIIFILRQPFNYNHELQLVIP